MQRPKPPRGAGYERPTVESISTHALVEALGPAHGGIGSPNAAAISPARGPLRHGGARGCKREG